MNDNPDVITPIKRGLEVTGATIVKYVGTPIYNALERTSAAILRLFHRRSTKTWIPKREVLADNVHLENELKKARAQRDQYCSSLELLARLAASNPASVEDTARTILFGTDKNRYLVAGTLVEQAAIEYKHRYQAMAATEPTIVLTAVS